MSYDRYTAHLTKEVSFQAVYSSTSLVVLELKSCGLTRPRPRAKYSSWMTDIHASDCDTHEAD